MAQAEVLITGDHQELALATLVLDQDPPLIRSKGEAGL
jgi:hypothetical protein